MTRLTLLVPSPFSCHAVSISISSNLGLGAHFSVAMNVQGAIVMQRTHYGFDAGRVGRQMLIHQD